ncbi:hypothetical protein [Paenibacillus chitinolyticus]|uniref:hypothetical protein n=1 Tax=Paenibacillus chitinolyticus TaxID=79263 RepID=UPI003D03DBF4
MQDMFIKKVQNIVMKTLEKLNLLVKEWHLGKVKTVNPNGTLDVYIDGGLDATPSIPANPQVSFKENDYVWVLFVNRNQNNLFVMSKRYVDSVQYNPSSTELYAPINHNHNNQYSPLGHKHTRLASDDSRSVPTTPGSYIESGLSVSFKDSSSIGLNGADLYSLVIAATPWIDDSGGGNYELAFSGGSMWMRYGTRSGGWGAWKKVSMSS